MTGSPGVLNSGLCILNLQQFVNYISGFPTLALVPQVVSTCGSISVRCDPLLSAVSPVLGASVCPGSLCPRNPRRAVDFLVYSAFCYWDGVAK